MSQTLDCSQVEELFKQECQYDMYTDDCQALKELMSSICNQKQGWFASLFSSSSENKSRTTTLASTQSDSASTIGNESTLAVSSESAPAAEGHSSGGLGTAAAAAAAAAAGAAVAGKANKEKEEPLSSGGSGSSGNSGGRGGGYSTRPSAGFSTASVSGGGTTEAPKKEGFFRSWIRRGGFGSFGSSSSGGS